MRKKVIAQEIRKIACKVAGCASSAQRLRTMQTTFGERLADAIAASPMTQGQIAASANVGAELLSRWKRLKTAPGSATVAVVAAALGVNADWLASGVGDPERGALGGPTRAEYDALVARVAELERHLGVEPQATTTAAAAAAASAARATRKAGAAPERSQPSRSARQS
jgi:transcriptional regulator with XRE-family HTH domain